MLAWLRRGRDGRFVVVIANFTPEPRSSYRIGVPLAGGYREILNSDSAHYGGSNLGNWGRIEALDGEWMNRPASLEATLPPLGLVILQPV